MPLIKSISGIRGTIGGIAGDNLTPLDVVKFAAAYGSWLQKVSDADTKLTVVIGRDGRVSGAIVKQLVTSTLNSLGIDVIDTDYSTTPTVEMAVVNLKAAGGIIITASHNPKEWNALKLLNSRGEFIGDAEGKLILQLASQEAFTFSKVEELGRTLYNNDTLDEHITAIVNHPLVDVRLIGSAKFCIVADVINSTGAIALPRLFEAIGVTDFTLINEENTGLFEHNPEPLPENLVVLGREVVRQNASLGIAVDPDVDRLCFVCEDGSMFGEEYTLVAVADYVLGKLGGNSVSNMSSTRALKDVTEKHGGQYFASAVGEVNVVNKMKEVNAKIGGEGNGGVIVPDLHYGRDALIGIALFLTHLAAYGKGIKKLRGTYPDYFMSKNKIQLTKDIDAQAVFAKIKDKYKNQPINAEDGLKIEFDTDWVHLRTSNTEPIIRIYAESKMEHTANNIATRLVKDIQDIIDNREF